MPLTTAKGTAVLSPSVTHLPPRTRNTYYTVNAAAAFLQLDPRKIHRECPPTASLAAQSGGGARGIWSEADLLKFAARVADAAVA